MFQNSWIWTFVYNRTISYVFSFQLSGKCVYKVGRRLKSDGGTNRLSANGKCNTRNRLIFQKSKQRFNISKFHKKMFSKYLQFLVFRIFRSPPTGPQVTLIASIALKFTFHCVVYAIVTRTQSKYIFFFKKNCCIKSKKNKKNCDALKTITKYGDTVKTTTKQKRISQQNKKRNRKNIQLVWRYSRYLLLLIIIVVLVYNVCFKH